MYLDTTCFWHSTRAPLRVTPVLPLCLTQPPPRVPAAGCWWGRRALRRSSRASCRAAPSTGAASTRPAGRCPPTQTASRSPSTSTVSLSAAAAGGGGGGGGGDVAPDEGSTKYKLCGFVTHLGKSTGTGHYVAHIQVRVMHRYYTCPLSLSLSLSLSFFLSLPLFLSLAHR